jgi:thioredoxin 1
MSLVTIDQDSFESLVEQPGIAVVDCWAAWCGPCKVFAPIFERVAGNHPEHTFAKLDSESEKDLVKSLGIEQIPALLIYRDGILLFRQPGSFSEEQLEDLVHQAETIDMEMVRRDQAAEEAKRRGEKASD